MNDYRIDCNLLEYMTNRSKSVRAAVHCDVDPVSGVAEVSVYTDDGLGNGNLIFSIPLAKLLRAIAEANTP